MTILRSLIFAYAFLQGQQVLTVEVAPGKQVPPPATSAMGFSAIAGGEHPSNSSPALAINIKLLRLDETGTSVTYELSLTNPTDNPIVVPVGLDGKAAVEKCHDSLFRRASLSYSAPWMKHFESHGIADFYGCPELDNSTVILNRGDWVTITGSHKIPKGPPDALSAHISFEMSSEQYRTQDGKTTADSTTLVFIGADHSLD